MALWDQKFSSTKVSLDVNPKCMSIKEDGLFKCMLIDPVFDIGSIGEDDDQNSNEPYQDNKLHHNERQ